MKARSWLALGAIAALALFVLAGCGWGVTPLVSDPNVKFKVIYVFKNSSGAYEIDSHHKSQKLKKNRHEEVVWVFAGEAMIDSVTAVFNSLNHPFSRHRFEFSAHPEQSDTALVAADSAVAYPYVITVYPHGASASNVDPGIIIE